MKVGDEFEVVRPFTIWWHRIQWFKWQAQLSRAMGTMYADIGRLRVVHVQPKTSTAELTIELRSDAAGRHCPPIRGPAVPPIP